MRADRFTRLWGVALGGILTISACQSTAPRSHSSEPSNQFTPVSLSVHPLSHISLEDGGGVVLEACVQLKDRDGLPVRGLGILEVSLQQGGASGEAILTRRSWERDLSNARINLATFDPMTRSYLLRIDLEGGIVPRLPSLSATLREANGRVLRDEASLPILGEQQHPTQPVITTPDS